MKGGQKVTDLDSDTLFLEKEMDIHVVATKMRGSHRDYPILNGVRHHATNNRAANNHAETGLQGKRYLD